MKNSFYIGLIFLLIGSICLGIKFNLDLEDSIKVAEIEKIKIEKHFEEMEKRIRILEQDNYILRYGYENEKE